MKFDNENPENNYSDKNKAIIKKAYEKGILKYSSDAGVDCGKPLWCDCKNVDNLINLVKSHMNNNRKRN